MIYIIWLQQQWEEDFSAVKQRDERLIKIHSTGLISYTCVSVTEFRKEPVEGQGLLSSHMIYNHHIDVSSDGQ